MTSAAAAAAREHPMLFMDHLVRAIRNGRKTVTRRPLKPQPRAAMATGWYPDRYNGTSHWCFWGSPGTGDTNKVGDTIGACPYGEPGDRLWVRETWADLRGLGFDVPFAYRADGLDRNGQEDEDRKQARLDFGVPWRPSIFMPRAACRLVLEVLSVRVERLQGITDADLLAEGMQPVEPQMAAARHAFFCEGWTDLYHAQPALHWKANPWVWRVEFRPIAKEP